MKPLRFLGTSKEDLTAFPDSARTRSGFELFEIQRGNEPSDWKPFPQVGPGVNEIRIHADGAWRVMYVAKFADAVYVLHAFEKKTQKTAAADIAIAQKRYKEIKK